MTDILSALKEIKFPCHWDKGLICERGGECFDCNRQPADEDKPNGKNNAVFIGWESSMFGTFPYCPSCGEMPYSTERCIFCGQKFIPDEAIAEYNKPLEKATRDCPMCGGEKTLIGTIARSNGHFHGKCEKCGCEIIE